jgi:hypothetical protein
MTLRWTQGSLAEGLRRYEASEFFAAREARESRWLESQEPERTFLHALIQVTAALHHLHLNNLVASCPASPGPYPASFGGISVTLLREDIRERLWLLKNSSAGRGPKLRRVRMPYKRFSRVA